MDLKSTTEEMVPIRVAPKTKGGKPAKLDGTPVLSIVSGGATARAATSEELDADVAAGKEGLVGYLLSEDVPGVSTWKIEADADLGEGVTSIVDGGSYAYNDPLADNLGVTSEGAVPKVA